MAQPVGGITQLRLYPIRALWSVGPGWAAVGGALASGGFVLSSEALLNLLLVWLLADPVLGVVWGLSVGGNISDEGDGGIWRRLLNPQLPDVAPPLHFLPYTQPDSPGRRLADRLGRLRLWWSDTFWPEAGREFATIIASLGLALLLGAILGRDALALVLISITLTWLAVFPQSERAPNTPGIASRAPKPGPSAARPTGLRRKDLPLPSPNSSIVTLWRVLAEFGIPWLIGAVVLGKPTWAAIALGGCYTITYFGLIRQAIRPTHNFRLIGASQATATLLIAGLRHPLAAGATVILLLPQWGLRTRANLPGDAGPYLKSVQFFVVLSILVAALAVAL